MHRFQQKSEVPFPGTGWQPSGPIHCIVVSRMYSRSQHEWFGNQVPQFDCSKAKLELGLTFMDVRQTAQDMAAALLELGLVKRLPGAPVGKFYPAYAKL